jgi:hypothetical protein
MSFRPTFLFHFSISCNVIGVRSCSMALRFGSNHSGNLIDSKARTFCGDLEQDPTRFTVIDRVEVFPVADRCHPIACFAQTRLIRKPSGRCLLITIDHCKSSHNGLYSSPGNSVSHCSGLKFSNRREQAVGINSSLLISWILSRSHS